MEWQKYPFRKEGNISKVYFLFPSMRTIVAYHFLAQITCQYRILLDDLTSCSHSFISYGMMVQPINSVGAAKYSRILDAQNRYGNLLMLHVTLKLNFELSLIS